MDYKKLVKEFSSRYSTSPRIFRSPGRINLIGEHTDYNNGFVLPAGVDKEICLLMAPSKVPISRIYALDQNEEVSFSLDDYRKIETHWAKYIIGVIDELLKRGKKVQSVDILFCGDIPMGAGMSSSAALECAAVFAYNSLFNLRLERWEMVKIAQAAENNFIGLKCGIMDQFASMFSIENAALKLDCRNLEFTIYPLNIQNYVFLLVDTMVKHTLASSEYNTRRIECEAGVKILQTINPKIQSLRDAQPQQIEAVKDKMGEVIYRRCHFVVSEIERVNLATEALLNNNFERVGELLYQTHEGLQHAYEVSCTESDFLVDFTRDLPYVLGARMMGGGFGGCTINLVEASKAQQFEEEISRAYQANFNVKPAIYKVKTSAGTSEIINL